MSTGLRQRAVSAPVTPIELRELNKFKDKRICKEDIEIFIEKYEKERNKILNVFFGFPPEINILRIIVSKNKSLLTRRTPISDSDKETLSAMIAMNKEKRPEKLRLRDIIIDSMVKFFDLEKDVERQYLSFDDFI